VVRTTEVLRTRLNDAGFRSFALETEGQDRIRVLLPALHEAELDRALRLLTRPGRLEFRIVAREETAAGERAIRERAGDGYKGPPDGYAWFPVRTRVDTEGRPMLRKPSDRLLEVDPANLFTGADFDPGELEVRPDQMGIGYVVFFAIREARKDEFETYTGKNIRRQMAILLDGRIEAAPIIMQALPGSAVISGGGPRGFSEEEAEELVTVLRSGCLPARLVLLEQEDLRSGGTAK
jgi:preprotein translocase subunit SecD